MKAQEHRHACKNDGSKRAFAHARTSKQAGSKELFHIHTYAKMKSAKSFPAYTGIHVSKIESSEELSDIHNNTHKMEADRAELVGLVEFARSFTKRLVNGLIS